MQTERVTVSGEGDVVRPRLEFGALPAACGASVGAELARRLLRRDPLLPQPDEALARPVVEGEDEGGDDGIDEIDGQKQQRRAEKQPWADGRPAVEMARGGDGVAPAHRQRHVEQFV